MYEGDREWEGRDSISLAKSGRVYRQRIELRNFEKDSRQLQNTFN